VIRFGEKNKFFIMIIISLLEYIGYIFHFIFNIIISVIGILVIIFVPCFIGRIFIIGDKIIQWILGCIVIIIGILGCFVIIIVSILISDCWVYS
jgi:hypothetical protein